MKRLILLVLMTCSCVHTLPAEDYSVVVSQDQCQSEKSWNELHAELNLAKAIPRSYKIPKDCKVVSSIENSLTHSLKRK